MLTSPVSLMQYIYTQYIHTIYTYFISGTLKSVLLMYSNTRAGVLDCGIPKKYKKRKNNLKQRCNAHVDMPVGLTNFDTN